MNFITRLCPIPIPYEQQHFLGANEWAINRKEAHTASKIALCQAFREFHLLATPSNREETQAAISKPNLLWFHQHHAKLAEQDFFHLEQHHDILCSRTHTKYLAAGAIAALGLGLYSIGIDLEAMDRKIQPQVEKFFLNDNEPQLFGPPNLALWVVKEAVFKAISSYTLHQCGQAQQGLTLKSIQLQASSEMEGQFHWAPNYRGFYKIILLRPPDLGDYLLVEASLTEVP
jgi:phosphopantetheinyl transferase (holo-ACP synthase)